VRPSAFAVLKLMISSNMDYIAGNHSLPPSPRRASCDRQAEIIGGVGGQHPPTASPLVFCAESPARPS